LNGAVVTEGEESGGTCGRGDPPRGSVRRGDTSGGLTKEHESPTTRSLARKRSINPRLYDGYKEVGGSMKRGDKNISQRKVRGKS